MAIKDHETITISDQIEQNSAEVEWQTNINKTKAFEKLLGHSYMPITKDQNL